jgi:hypothetical protein
MIVTAVVSTEGTIMVVLMLAAGMLILSRASGQPRKRSLVSMNALRI